MSTPGLAPYSSDELRTVLLLSHLADPGEIYVDQERAGTVVLEHHLFGMRHHGQTALGLVEEVLSCDHHGEILCSPCPDQVSPGGPQLLLVDPGGHEDDLSPTQCQSSGDLGHERFAAHRQPDSAVLALEHRVLVADPIIEIPDSAGVDPRPGRVGTAVDTADAAVGPDQLENVVSRMGFTRYGLQRPELDRDTVLFRRSSHLLGGVEGHRGAPRAGIGLGKRNDLSTLRGGVGDLPQGVHHIPLVVRRTMSDRLNKCQTKSHPVLPYAQDDAGVPLDSFDEPCLSPAWYLDLGWWNR